jgi:hypothetical protein
MTTPDGVLEITGEPTVDRSPPCPMEAAAERVFSLTNEAWMARGVQAAQKAAVANPLPPGSPE